MIRPRVPSSISAVETAEDTYKESIPCLEPFSKASVSNSTTESGDVLQRQDLPCSSNSSEQSTYVDPGHGTKFLTMLPLERDNNSKNIPKFQGGLSSGSLFPCMLDKRYSFVFFVLFLSKVAYCLFFCEWNNFLLCLFLWIGLLGF